MQFTDEEMKIIDRLLEEGEEMQRQNGDKTYTLEEMWGAVLEHHYKVIQNKR